MTTTAFVPFKELDYPSGPYQNGSSTVIYNLAPVEGYGYVVFANINSANPISATALDTDPRGGSSYWGGDPTKVYIYVGTTGRIYHETGSTLTNVSQGGVLATPYSTSTTDWGWSFTRWGDGVIATNYVDAVQYKPSLTATTAFVDLFTSTLKPKAKFMGLVKNQLFIANTNEGGVAKPNRVRWGAIDNALDMDASPTTQADFQDLLDDYGEITGFVGGEYGLVFKEKAIYKVSYVGPPLIYTIDLVASGIGTRTPGSIIEFQGRVYFWAANGIYKVNQGAESVEIVPEGIFKTLMTGFELPGGSNGAWPTDVKYNKTKYYNVHACVDAALGCLYWFFPSEAGGVRKMVLALSPNEKRSSVIDPVNSGSDYPTYGIQGPYFGNEKHVMAPSSDVVLAPTHAAVYAVNTAKKLTYFKSNLLIPPRIVSGMITADTGKRAVITAVRPIFLCPGSSADGIDPVSPVYQSTGGVYVAEVNYANVPQSKNDFVQGSGGWWYGRANGEFLVIGTLFRNSTGEGGESDPILSFPAVCAGWEVVFDEEASER